MDMDDGWKLGDGNNHSGDKAVCTSSICNGGRCLKGQCAFFLCKYKIAATLQIEEVDAAD